MKRNIKLIFYKSVSIKRHHVLNQIDKNFISTIVQISLKEKFRVCVKISFFLCFYEQTDTSLINYLPL